MMSKWMAKALLQKVLWYTPGGIGINERLSRMRAGHDVETESLKKHAPNFFRQIDTLCALRSDGAIGGTFLEIGSGWDLDIAWLARLCGFERAIATDAFRHLSYQQIAASRLLFPRLEPQIAQRTILSPLEIAAQILAGQKVRPEEFAQWAGIEYIAPISRDYREIGDGSCDVVYSTAVFEHIEVADVKNILRQIRRMLKPGGLTTHVIDLKDHFAYFQAGLPYNHCHRYSQAQWRFWTGNPLSFTNRLMVSDWEILFAEAGLKIIHLETVPEHSLPRLAASELHSDFRTRSERDLSTGEIHVVAQTA